MVDLVGGLVDRVLAAQVEVQTLVEVVLTGSERAVSEHLELLVKQGERVVADQALLEELERADHSLRELIVGTGNRNKVVHVLSNLGLLDEPAGKRGTKAVAVHVDQNEVLRRARRRHTGAAAARVRRRGRRRGRVAAVGRVEADRSEQLGLENLNGLLDADLQCVHDRERVLCVDAVGESSGSGNVVLDEGNQVDHRHRTANKVGEDKCYATRGDGGEGVGKGGQTAANGRHVLDNLNVTAQGIELDGHGVVCWTRLVF